MFIERYGSPRTFLDSHPEVEVVSEGTFVAFVQMGAVPGSPQVPPSQKCRQPYYPSSSTSTVVHVIYRDMKPSNCQSRILENDESRRDHGLQPWVTGLRGKISLDLRGVFSRVQKRLLAKGTQGGQDELISL